MRNKSITHNLFRIQDYEFIMCKFIVSISLDYTNLFSPNDYKKNDKIIFKYFKDKYGTRSKSRV